jgi:hypothetical protein
MTKILEMIDIAKTVACWLLLALGAGLLWVMIIFAAMSLMRVIYPGFTFLPELPW